MTRPVSIREFIYNADYLGRVLAQSIYPKIVDDLEELEARENSSIFVRHYALWDTKPGLSTVTFSVEVGDETRRPRVLDDHESQWPSDVNRQRVIRVPENFRLDFKRNPEKCVRDLAGISILSVTPFIHDRQSIRRMFVLGPRPA